MRKSNVLIVILGLCLVLDGSAFACSGGGGGTGFNKGKQNKGRPGTASGTSGISKQSGSGVQTKKVPAIGAGPAVGRGPANNHYPPRGGIVQNPSPRHPGSRLDSERGYLNNHRTRVSKINQKYDARIGHLQQQIQDWRAVQQAMSAGQRAEYERMIQSNQRQIAQLNAERRAKIEESRGIYERQAGTLWAGD
jgi:hypothetical protein